MQKPLIKAKLLEQVGHVSWSPDYELMYNLETKRFMVDAKEITPKTIIQIANKYSLDLRELISEAEKELSKESFTDNLI